MSYATSLLADYPTSYGPSTLLSDGLLARSSLGPHYETSVPYMSSSRLLSDDLTYGQIGLGPTIYRPSGYSHFPSTNYQSSSITNWRTEIPPLDSLNSLNDVAEYSDSLGTVSNTTPASSVARSINNNQYGSTKLFPNYQQSYNRFTNDADRSPHLPTMRKPSPLPPQSFNHNENKSTTTQHSFPELSTNIVQKKSPFEESKNDITPVPSPPPPPPISTKQESNLERTATLVENDKHRPSIDVQAWLNESENELPVDQKSAEKTWSNKIDQLHVVQAQREKEKAKSSQALPNISKKNGMKASTANNNKAHNTAFQMRHNSYFDSLFDGNFFRKTSTNRQNLTSSYQQSFATRNKPTTTIINKPTTTIFAKNQNYIPPRKPSVYKPPSFNRVPPSFSTTTWKKPLPKQDNNYSNNEQTHRENVPKDTDERYREALHKFRSDRTEQQQKEIHESTAKRLHYGDYVRHSTKGALLQNVIKPSPWSDFMDLKKGNLILLSKEEKKDLYNQSKSYGERVRFRNFTLHQGTETDRSHHRSIPLPVVNQESQSDGETSHEPDSKSLKRSESESTVKTTSKTFTKPIGNKDLNSHRSNTTMLTDRSSTIRPSEEEDEDESDFEGSRKQKKAVRHPKYDSSVQTTSASEESENDETDQEQSNRMKYRDTDDDLFTVREEKTMESLEGARYKKR